MVEARNATAQGMIKGWLSLRVNVNLVR